MRVGGLDTESAFDVQRRAHALEAQGRHVIHLEIGQPDFPTPAHVTEAAYRAIKDGATGYCAPEGLPALRDVIAEQVRATRGIDVSAANVVVTPGAKPILFFATLACVEPGDEVIYPDPGFPIYGSVVRFVGGVPVPLALHESLGFRIDLDELRDRVSPRTKMLILNSPQNPTGGVLTETELSEIGELARRYGFWIMSDEVYSRLIYDTDHVSILSQEGLRELTILVDGLSKTYSMTGWRLGWGVVPEELAAALALLMVNSNSCTATFTQHAAMAALEGPQDSVTAMREEFRTRRRLIADGLNAIDAIHCQEPDGAFYAFPNVRGITSDDGTFADRLLEEAGVAALAGSSFGGYGAGFLRLSYATSTADLEEAVRRIAGFVERYREQ